MKFIGEKIKSIKSELRFHNEWIYELEQKVRNIEENSPNPLSNGQETEAAFKKVFYGLAVSNMTLKIPDDESEFEGIDLQLIGNREDLIKFVDRIARYRK